MVSILPQLEKYRISITSPQEIPRKKEMESFRVRTAEKALRSLEHGNVAVVAATGTGKTIISFLVSIAFHTLTLSPLRVLFLVPQRILAEQHAKLLNEVAPGMFSSSIFIGGVKNRNWKDKNVDIIFATPQTFMSDFKKEIADVGDFNLIIVDEFHRARKNYDYVPISRLASEKKVKTLYLSASPGKNKARIEEIKKTCSISEWVQVEVPMPEKKEDVKIVEPGKKLAEIDALFQSMFRSLKKQFTNLGINFWEEGQKEFSFGAKKQRGAFIPKNAEIERIKRAAEKLPRSQIFEGRSLYSICRRVRHAHGVCLTESYETFIAFLERQKEKYKEKLKKERSAVSRFLNHPHIQKAREIAESHIDEHPKILELARTVSFHSSFGRNGIIFVQEKETGSHIKNVLEKQGVRAETLFGGPGKSIKKQNETIKKLRDREIDFVIATSVLKEGLNIPEIDLVIHYSLPLTGIERIQGNGRTGRTKSGMVIYIVLDHPLDTSRYWATRREVSEMKKALGGATRQLAGKATQAQYEFEFS